ncbi:hypothetical protein K2X85_05445 [bacterium]|nr:hypothetical protein [bacterium]
MCVTICQRHFMQMVMVGRTGDVCRMFMGMVVTRLVANRVNVGNGQSGHAGGQ